MISLELQRGRAAEHLVCADLLLQGYQACLTEQGMPYDILVDFNGQVYRVQVKSTMAPQYPKAVPKGIYRFSLRHGKSYGADGRHKTIRRIPTGSVDVVAFVALDRRVIAYLSVDEVRTQRGDFRQTMEFGWPGRNTGTRRQAEHTRIKDITEYPTLDGAI